MVQLLTKLQLAASREGDQAAVVVWVVCGVVLNFVGFDLIVCAADKDMPYYLLLRYWHA